MPYIIDGHNLIPNIPGLNLGDIDVEIRLIGMLQEYCRNRGVTTEVFFDQASPGHAGTRKHGRVTAHFVHGSSSADIAIRSYLRKARGSARNMIVVTSDREITASAREVGAKVIRSDQFVHNHLLDKPAPNEDNEKEPDISLNTNEVNEWMDFFRRDQGSDTGD
jgi:predicted RNA-binding protein with PIN domain